MAIFAFHTRIVHGTPDLTGTIGLCLFKVAGFALCPDGLFGVVMRRCVGIVTVGTGHKGHPRSNQFLILFVVFDEPALGINDEGISSTMATTTGLPCADGDVHFNIVWVLGMEAPRPVTLFALNSRECPCANDAGEIVLMSFGIVPRGMAFSAVIRMFFPGVVRNPRVGLQVILSLAFYGVNVAIGFDEAGLPSEAPDDIGEIAPVSPGRRTGIRLSPELIGRRRVVLDRSPCRQDV